MLCPNGHGLKVGNYCGTCGTRLLEEPDTLDCPWCGVTVGRKYWIEKDSGWRMDPFCFLCGRRFLDADGHLVVVPWWAQILARLGDLFIWTTACSP